MAWDLGSGRSPVVAAWGAGVDSSAMLIELVERGEPVDAVLFADVGDENPLTYLWLETFQRWLEARGVPVHVVRYAPADFKTLPIYATLAEECLARGTLPSMVYGSGTCSAKWKQSPQNRWTEQWAPARAIWAQGGKVERLIGFDCSVADTRRYAHASALSQDPRYINRYPLREFGWSRLQCEDRIRAAGLIPPPKSACFQCGATRPAELDHFDPRLLRRIVLIEARAKPRLRNVDGLWRKPVLGRRGATPRPGSMTAYIRDKALLPPDEIDAIATVAVEDLERFLASVGTGAERPAIARWLAWFDAASAEGRLTSAYDAVRPVRSAAVGPFSSLKVANQVVQAA